MKKRTYKLLFALSLVAILTLTACSDSSNTDSSTPASNSEQSKAVSEESKAPADESKESSSEEASTSDSFKLGEAFTLGDYTITIKKFSLAKDHDGKPVLVYTYDWKNNSKEQSMPGMSFSMMGFQDGVETDSPGFVEKVNYDKGQKEVKTGGSIKDAQGTVGINDMSKPMELEISPAFSFDDTKLTYKIENLKDIK